MKYNKNEENVLTRCQKFEFIYIFKNFKEGLIFSLYNNIISLYLFLFRKIIYLKIIKI